MAIFSQKTCSRREGGSVGGGGGGSVTTESTRVGMGWRGGGGRVAGEKSGRWDAGG